MDFFDPKNTLHVFTRQPNPERGLFMAISLPHRVAHTS